MSKKRIDMLENRLACLADLQKLIGNISAGINSLPSNGSLKKTPLAEAKELRSFVEAEISYAEKALCVAKRLV